MWQMAVLLYLHVVEKGLARPLASCNKGTSSICESSTSWPDWFSKAPPLNTTTLGLGFQHMKFGRTQDTPPSLPGCHLFIQMLSPLTFYDANPTMLRGIWGVLCSEVEFIFHGNPFQHWIWSPFGISPIVSFANGCLQSGLHSILSLVSQITTLPLSLLIRGKLSTESSLIFLLILTTLAFSCYHTLLFLKTSLFSHSFSYIYLSGVSCFYLYFGPGLFYWPRSDMTYSVCMFFLSFLALCPFSWKHF